MHKIDYVATTIAMEKHGILTYEDLIIAGYNKNQIQYYFTSGHIEKLFNGVYFNKVALRSKKSDILANILRSPNKAAASHSSALYLYGLADTNKTIELTVNNNVNRKDKYAKLYRVKNFHQIILNDIESIPTVSLERAIVASFANSTASKIQDLFANSIINKTSTLEKLNSELILSPRVFGRSQMREMLKNLELDLKDIESIFELRIVRVIKKFNLEIPVRQYKLNLDGYRFRLDFAYPKYKLYIEADGFKYHSSDGNFINDRRRQNILSIHGWQVIRLTPRMSDLEIARYIASMLEANIF